MNTAEIYYLYGNYSEALKLYRRVSKEGKSDTVSSSIYEQALYWAALINISRRNYKDALSDLNKINIKYRSSYLYALLLKGKLFFEKEEYAARREKLMDQIPDGFLVIRGAAMPGSFTQFYQYNNLMYLSGVEIPDVVLVIDGRERKSTLFLTISESHARSEGIDLRVVRDPASVTGIEHVLPLEEFTSFLDLSVKDCKMIYAPFSSNELMAEVSREKNRSLLRSMTEDEWDGRETREIQFVNLLKGKYPDLSVRDCSPMIWDLRKIKSKAEVDLMRKCGRIGVEAHLAFMRSTGADVSERSLANIFEYTCKDKGANGLAYNTIIMSGLNHAFGHYHRYDRTLKDGDFIILDAGPDYKYYDVDISTTFPANGKFSPVQKEIKRVIKIQDIIILIITLL